jgi:hypothetical protein
MNRRNFLVVGGVTAGGGTTAYVLSQRESNGEETPSDNETDDYADDADEPAEDDSTEEVDDEPHEYDNLEGRLEHSEGMIVFTYDDTPVEDYTLTYQIHEEYEVPGCLAACPGLMGDSDDFLKPDQLIEIYDAGWTVMSHTYDHRALGHTSLTQPAEEGDDRVYVEWGRHGDFESDPLVVFDDAGARVETSVAGGGGSDSNDAYIDLEEPLSESVSEEGYLRHPEEFIQEILEQTDEQLDDWGIDVTGFIYPYDRYHGVVEEVVRDHYEAVGNHRYGGGHNNIDGLDPTTMQRLYIETDKSDEADIDEFMQTAAAEPVLSIVGAHSNFETFAEDRLRYTIDAALENDLAIVTLDEALGELGFQDS